jgi:mannose-1-phosphate guanylyltransferase/mannose-1-phosphate guanylyltransferase/mannose-6-phosphate isomerase
LEKYKPDLLEHIKSSFEKSADDLDFKRLHSESFCKIEPVSIDYAIMEHLDNLVVVRHHGDWSDVGSWDGWGDLVDEDGLHNKTIGEVVLYDSTNNIINARSRLVVAVGLEDVAIVETSDAVLVSDKDHLQKIKDVVPTLEGLSYSQATKHPTDYRPWGHFDSLIIGDRYQVKKIVVNPGGKLSLQKHHHRSEHWIVVRGTAEVQVGDKTMILSENQSTYIPLGVDHRLSNPGKVPLTLIEIQTGSYLGEDDIVRLEDIYERL